jgi:rubrerythrin
MNWKIFLSTFALIFLAELGDKTQLAAMARAADSPHARWVVFAAACAALILSTLVAVLFGGAISKLVPERYIRIGAGVLFVVFGLLLLHTALAAPTKTVKAVSVPRPLAAFVLKQVEVFEEATCQDYRELATRVSDPALGQLLTELAEEEASHLETIRSAVVHADESGDPLPLSTEIGDLHPDLATDSSDRPIIEHAIEHEQAACGFYRELAGLTPIPALTQIFTELADAEQQHVDRLKALLDA